MLGNMPTDVLPLTWNRIIKSTLNEVELQPKWFDTRHVNIPYDQLPLRQKHIAKKIRSLVS